MKKLINICLMIVIIIPFIIPQNVYAAKTKTTKTDSSYTINVDDYKPGTGEESKVLKTKANRVISVLSTIGMIVSVVALMILGIKYMIGSIEERAEYKKDFIPYLIGAFLVFTVSLVPQLIFIIMDKLNG